MAFSRGGVATQRGTHGSLVVVGALVMLGLCSLEVEELFSPSLSRTTVLYLP